MLTPQFETQPHLPFTGEFVTDPEGVSCPVLDLEALDFSNAAMGHKKKPTRVIKVGPEGVVTGQIFDGHPETFCYEAHEGDALMINDIDDIYVPTDEEGRRLKFDQLEDHGYEIVRGNGDEIFVLCPPAALLVGIVTTRICLKCRWGEEDIPENHQFLSAGATLKKDSHGRVTGMDEHGFAKWEVIGDAAPTFFEQHLS